MRFAAVLAWPIAERQIGHRKSSLVLSARFHVVKWRSRSVAKSAYYKVTQETGSELVLRNSPTVQFDTTPNCFHAPAP